ncbi:MAG: bifunctional metallophosphatase/5'-nucleotidase [Elusimicrobiaceae bacterium]|nr:bifunctional metallophosphatase/5'-nucleotidase [Elusimicrobiaceae bacterium]
MRKISLLAVVLFTPLFLLGKTTVVYHTSDTHGFFFPRHGVGGFAALAKVLKNGPQPYLLLDSGDFSNGTVETRNSKGIKATQIMNKMGYDATTLGNHEFDFKAAQFPAIVEALDFPMLAANFFEKDSQKYPPHIVPYTIIKANGVKFAVIGLGNRTPTNPAEGYYFAKPLVALDNALNEVEKQNPDVVIVLAHDSIADDKHGTKSYLADIAKEFSGRVHIVMGGHAHKIVQNRKINGVLFVESGCYVNFVSKVTVETDDKTGKFVSAKSEIIPLIIANVGEDKATQKYLETLREQGMDTPVGETTEILSKMPTSDDRLDSPLNDWIADLLKDYAGTQIAIHNNGGTRVDLPKGSVTKRDIVDVHPFDNTVTVVTLKGKFLKRFIKNGFAPRTLFTYAGLQIYYKKDKQGNIQDIEILFNGKPLENKKEYTVVTNSYIASGGSEGHLFKQLPESAKKLAGPKTIRDLMEDALKKGPVSAPQTGRILEVK